jgi:hypothetical protein
MRGFPYAKAFRFLDEPMTLGNMRELGLLRCNSLLLRCNMGRGRGFPRSRD